jgi:hypothetical protein
LPMDSSSVLWTVGIAKNTIQQIAEAVRSVNRSNVHALATTRSMERHFRDSMNLLEGEIREILGKQ